VGRRGRPRKYEQGRRVLSISYPESEEIYVRVLRVLDLIAQREGLSRSELIWKVIKEHAELHLRGNPTIPLPEYNSEVDDLELELTKAELRSLLKRPIVDAWTGQMLIDDAKKALPRARRLLAKTGDPELRDLIVKLTKKIKGGR